ncbi:unnamed protein product [Agarophyton chilense]
MTSSATVPFNSTVKITDKNVSKPTRKKGRRDCYTRFSALEEAHLLEGVRKYGAGKWKKILTCYEFHWKRTAVDLKDKYRNIIRAQEREKRKRLERMGVSKQEAGTNDDHLANVPLRSGMVFQVNSVRGNMNESRLPRAGYNVQNTSEDSKSCKREKRIEAPSAMKLARLLCYPEGESY